MVNRSRTLAEERMAHQLETWVTEQDFKEISELGFNSVRLPVGYWNIIKDPYNMYAPADNTKSLRYIDFAFDMADKYGLTVLLDLHGAPGSQNGKFV
jgi:glucan 1,3-beta-glucosidase